MRVLGSFPREVVPDSLATSRSSAAAALPQQLPPGFHQAQQPPAELPADGLPQSAPAVAGAEPGQSASNGASQPPQPQPAERMVWL